MTRTAMFRDRIDAGRQLAQELTGLELAQPVVVALPHGGVPVGFAVAQVLRAPLDVLVVRRLASPRDNGANLGAVAEGGVGYLHPFHILESGASGPEVEAIAAAELREVQRRVDIWRGAWPPVPVEGRSTIVVDDGLVTGDRVRAAVLALRHREPASLILAVPVASTSTLEALAAQFDGLVCLRAEVDVPPQSEIYEDASAVTDRDVAQLLERAQAWDASTDVHAIV